MNLKEPQRTTEKNNLKRKPTKPKTVKNTTQVNTLTSLEPSKAKQTRLSPNQCQNLSNGGNPISECSPDVGDAVNNMKSLVVSKVDKAVGTPTMTTKIRSRTLMIFNAQESTQTSLRAREDHDIQMWNQIASILKLETHTPTSIHRLEGGSKTYPRPIRIELSSARLVERVLLMAPDLKGSTLDQLRLRPDRSKSERSRKLTKEIMLSHQIVIRGVPEPTDFGNTREHDVGQWEYISSKLQLEELTATAMSRLPRPAHLTTLTHPRLLRITLATSDMVADVLENWRSCRPKLPSDIIIHSCTDREHRRISRTQTADTHAVPALTLIPTDLDTEEPKNGLEPAQ
jgi:hypothetical protein